MNWLLHTVLGGGLLLLVGWAWMRRVSSPARRQHLGKSALLAALVVAVLSLGPAWLRLPVLTPAETSLPFDAPPTVPSPPPMVFEAPPPPPAAAAQGELLRGPGLLAEEAPANPVAEPDGRPAPGDHSQAAAPPPEVGSATPPAVAAGAPWSAWLVRVVPVGYLCVAAFLLGRWMLGLLALRRLLRRCRPAGGAAARLFAEMAGEGRPPRLLISPDVRVPFSCGPWRPTVVVPAGLVENAPEGVLRWVFAHELDHLARHDARGALLFGLGQVVYFYLPWFWWLRRQVYLCQEYLADAAAARTGAPLDYAEFLAGWAEAPALPAGVTGVSGSCSDLFRRIAMLVQTRDRLEPGCSRGWSLWTGGVLLSAAVLAAGLGATAAPVDPPKKERPKKVEGPKKERPGKVEDPLGPGFPALEEMLDRLPPGIDPKVVEELRKVMKEQPGIMKEALRGMPPGFAGMAGMPGLFGAGHTGRLGVKVATPSATLAEQLDLPRDQGIVVEEVTPKSPAEKAGLKAHDILLEVNGKPVPRSPEGVAKMVAEIKADTEVDAVVLRKGRRETIKGLKLPEAPRGGLGVGMFPGGGLPGGLPVGGLPPMMPNIAAVAMAGGGGGVMTTLFRSNDRFTLRHQEGSLVITVNGTVADGKTKVSEIRVQDGRESHKYESAEKVPEEYHDKVKNLLEMSEKSNAKIEIKVP